MVKPWSVKMEKPAKVYAKTMERWEAIRTSPSSAPLLLVEHLMASFNPSGGPRLCPQGNSGNRGALFGQRLQFSGR